MYFHDEYSHSVYNPEVKSNREEELGLTFLMLCDSRMWEIRLVVYSLDCKKVFEKCC